MPDIVFLEAGTAGEGIGNDEEKCAFLYVVWWTFLACILTYDGACSSSDDPIRLTG